MKEKDGIVRFMIYNEEFMDFYNELPISQNRYRRNLLIFFLVFIMSGAIYFICFYTIFLYV